jgi:flagellar assembly protein FliH
MSSKLIGSEVAGSASRLIWRQVRVESDRPANEPPEDVGALITRLEQQRDEQVRECEKSAREAHAAGVREGDAAGHDRAMAELKPVIERLSRSIEELANLRPKLRRDAEADMVKLALAIARRVLRRELAIDPDALHGLVLAALEKLQGQEVYRVKVHPTHAAAIAAYLSNSPSGQKVEVLPFAASEPGAAVFETARGILEASVDSQLQEIERGLADQLKRHS